MSGKNDRCWPSFIYINRLMKQMNYRPSITKVLSNAFEIKIGTVDNFDLF